MALNTLLHLFVPKNDKFFEYLSADVENLMTATKLFSEVMSRRISKREREQKIRRIEELEHKGDEITHQIFSELGKTFITPIDREDIHALTSTLDDILDYLHGAAGRLILYRVKQITPEMERLAELIADSVTELHAVIPLLQDFSNSPVILEKLVRINSIENEADDIFERAIASLFETCRDPILLIKTKEILVSLETATDQCEDAANVIESIVVKNA